MDCRCPDELCCRYAIEGKINRIVGTRYPHASGICVLSRRNDSSKSYTAVYDADNAPKDRISTS